MPELTEAEVPEATRCPYCGGKPTDEVRHHLSALGYIHDDIRLKCADCNKAWICGVPQGDPEERFWDDLLCKSCGERFYKVHRVEVPENGTIGLHLKCPNCFYFDQTQRKLDENGRALIGHPDITGATEGAEAYGYVR